MSADRPAELVHATTVAIGGRAVLLAGASGSGKSDLALRLIDRGATLVADDYTALSRSGDGLVARCRDTIQGLLEVRGIGIVAMPILAEAPVALWCDLDCAPDRLPEDGASRALLGLPIARIALSPFEASAPIKVELALGRAIGDMR